MRANAIWSALFSSPVIFQLPPSHEGEHADLSDANLSNAISTPALA